jgi:hypothetical protein
MDLAADKIHDDVEVSQRTAEIIAVVGDDFIGPEFGRVTDIFAAAGGCNMSTKMVRELD